MKYKYISTFIAMAQFSLIAQAMEAQQDNQHQWSTRLVNATDVCGDELHAIVDMINHAYWIGEKDILPQTTPRTSTQEVKDLIEANAVIGLFVNNTLKGCVYVKQHEKEMAIFGMLTVAIDLRGRGFGNRLVNAAETYAKGEGYKYIVLELVKPLGFQQEHKNRLEEWYKRMGYQFKEQMDFPKPELLMPNEKFIVKIFQKAL